MRMFQNQAKEMLFVIIRGFMGIPETPLIEWFAKRKAFKKTGHEIWPTFSPTACSPTTSLFFTFHSFVACPLPPR